MTISFGGLATGLDTNSIINQLIAIESAPIARMEADKAWLNNRLAAFTEFDKLLNNFLDSAETLNNLDSYNKRTATADSEDFLKATASADAVPGVSYNVEIESLARVQKSHTATGFASDTVAEFGTGNLVITVGETEHTIAITSENNTLHGIMEAINNADIGISASIISE